VKYDTEEDGGFSEISLFSVQKDDSGRLLL
jgi:hypothetical protein